MNLRRDSCPRGRNGGKFRDKAAQLPVAGPSRRLRVRQPGQIRRCDGRRECPRSQHHRFRAQFGHLGRFSAEGDGAGLVRLVLRASRRGLSLRRFRNLHRRAPHPPRRRTPDRVFFSAAIAAESKSSSRFGSCPGMGRHSSVKRHSPAITFFAVPP